MVQATTLERGALGWIWGQRVDCGARFRASVFRFPCEELRVPNRKYFRMGPPSYRISALSSSSACVRALHLTSPLTLYIHSLKCCVPCGHRGLWASAEKVVPSSYGQDLQFSTKLFLACLPPTQKHKPSRLQIALMQEQLCLSPLSSPSITRSMPIMCLT